jgi:hypothetical protein
MLDEHDSNPVANSKVLKGPSQKSVIDYKQKL